MFVESMYADIYKMIAGLIVKRDDLAKVHETVHTIRAYDRYFSFLNNVKYDHIPLDEDLLMQVLPTYEMVAKALESRYNVPVEYRNMIYQKHKSRYYTNYVENNNYYRQLNGLPDLEDNTVILVPGVPGVRDNVPIWQLNLDEIGILSITGKIAEIQKQYPSIGYLKFLGSNAIHFHTARQTPNFYILKLGTSSSSQNEQIFRREYHKAVKFHMGAIYKRDLFSDTEMYDGMLGMMILISAIRNALSSDMYLSLTTEFLDNMLKAYGLYADFKTLPFVYKKRLVLNLDKLISRKKTDIVLVDIAYIFGYSNVIANRYYLMKTHAKDINGNPIYPKLPDGSIDYVNQYNVEFLKVDVAEKYIDLESENTLSYGQITENDPLWEFIDIPELKKDDFNIRMSKYMSIEAAYNVTQLSYELSYFLNLLLDTKDFHTVRYPNKYSAAGESNIFTYIIFMLSASARLNQYDGNIPVVPANVGIIYKFNLVQAQSILDEIITTYGLNLDSRELLLSKPTTSYPTTEGIISTYVANTAIYDRLFRLRDAASTYTEYTGYDMLLRMLFTAQNASKVYKKSNGDVADTYLELLIDLDPSLGSVITSSTSDNISSIYLFILESLQGIFDTDVLHFLFINTPDMNDGILQTHMKNLVERFKAPAVELDKIDIYFSVDKDSAVHRIFDEMDGTVYRRGVSPGAMIDSFSSRVSYPAYDELSVTDSLKTII